MHHRTTTGAAEHLGIWQPAVSSAIKSLEKQLDASKYRLFAALEAGAVF